MSAPQLPDLLAIWYAEHISHLQAALGVPVALVENNPDRDYGGLLPGPPCRLVLRAELVDSRTLNAYRDYAGGLPSDPEAAGWSVCVHRWTADYSLFEASAHTEGDSPEDLAAIACAAVREAEQHRHEKTRPQ